MKTAITIWNDRVSPVFDVTGQAMLFEAEGGRIASEQMMFLPDASAAEKVVCLLEAGTDFLICGAISREAYSTATNAGIEVYPFVAGNVGDILQAFLTGRLEDSVFAMPGCACRMACPGRCNQGQEKGGLLVPHSSAGRKPDKKGV